MTYRTFFVCFFFAEENVWQKFAHTFASAEKQKQKQKNENNNNKTGFLPAGLSLLLQKTKYQPGLYEQNYLPKRARVCLIVISTLQGQSNRCVQESCACVI